jgi:hypothetical protein
MKSVFPRESTAIVGPVLHCQIRIRPSVTLTNGTVIEVKLFDANDLNIQPDPKFTLLDMPMPPPKETIDAVARLSRALEDSVRRLQQSVAAANGSCNK